jgi:uncharacterized protein YgiM (DUF1202 family)
MKRVLSLLTAVALLTCAFASGAIAQSSVSVHAFINPIGKLHLRTAPSTSSASMGLFYPGVVMECLSDISNPNTTWIKVRIGAQIGYMMRAYLEFGLPDDISITSAQPTVWVRTGAYGNSMNLYTVPIDRATVVGSVKGGDFVTVLGETADHWYYVRTNDGVFGYAKTQYFSTSALPISPSVTVAAVVNNPNPSDRLNLRVGPSSDADSLGRYYNGTAVTIIEYTSETWAKVRISAGQGGIEGYAMRQYLSTDGSYIASAIPTYYVNTSRLVMRTSRSTSSAPMGSYKRGTAVEILGYGETWHHVRVGGKIGFMHASYLTPAFLDGNASPNTDFGYVRMSASTPAN